MYPWGSPILLISRLLADYFKNFSYETKYSRMDQVKFVEDSL